MPTVSICIPTYRRLNYLTEAVEAARAQTLHDIEIIISDDGTSEEIRMFSLACARKDPRVRYRRNERNLGLGGNWNECVKAATGEWLVIQGDDDRLLPEFCERLLQLASADSVVIFSNHHVIDAEGARLPEESVTWTARYRRTELGRGRVADTARCVWQNSVPMTSALIRTSAIQRLGVKPELNTPEIEVFARLAAEGARFDFEPDYLAEFRSHGGSSTADGLFSERLVRHLEPIPVPPNAAAAKREFMAALTRSAVDRLLRAGELASARRMMANRYYPGSLSDATCLAQAVATRLPARLGRRAYLFARRIHEARAGLRR